MKLSNFRSRRLRGSGFTLLEILVVLAIVSVLLLIVVGSIAKVSSRANSVQTLSNLRTIGQGIHAYAQDHDLYYPTVYTRNSDGFHVWMNLLNYRGYIDDGIAVMSSSGVIVSSKQLLRLYNPVTRDADPRGSNSGGYGLNGFYTTAPQDESPVRTTGWNRHVNIQEIERPSQTVLVADGMIDGNGNTDVALLDFGGYTYFPSTRSGGAAHYLFCDWHVERIDARDPSELNSPPVGYKSTVFFNPLQY